MYSPRFTSFPLSTRSTFLPVVDNRYNTNVCLIGLALIACVYLISVDVDMKKYATINDDGVITRPLWLSYPGAMEHASVEHRLFRDLGSRFHFTCATTQVLIRPIVSSLVEGRSSLTGHVRIIQSVYYMRSSSSHLMDRFRL